MDVIKISQPPTGLTKAATAPFAGQLSLVLLLSAFIYLLRSNMVQGFHRSENGYAEGAREMLFRHELIAPLCQNIPSFDKPPLFFWLTMSSLQLCGVSMLSARAVSSVAAVLLVLFTALFARAHFGNRFAILSAMMCATGFCFFEMASICMPDMWLSLFEFSAVICLYQIVYGEKERQMTWSILASVCFALGWMTKGPVAVVIPMAAIVALMICFRTFLIPPVKQILIGLLIFFILVLPWHIAVYQGYGVSAFAWLYWQGMVDRLLSVHAQYDFGHPVTYMLKNALTGFLPWTVFMVPAIGHIIWQIKTHRPLNPQQRIVVYMLLFSAITVAFFSVTNSNWGYYNLPIFPALSIVTAYFMHHCMENDSKFMRLFGSVFAFLLIIGPIVGYPKAASYLKDAGSALPMAVVAIMSIAAFMLFLFVKRRYYAAYCTIFALYVVAVVPYALVFLPAKATEEEFLSLSALVQKMPNEENLYLFEDIIGQVKLVDHVAFESRRDPRYCNQAELVALLKGAQKNNLLISQHSYDKLPEESKKHLTLLKAVKMQYIYFPTCKLNEGSSDKVHCRILLMSSTQ